MTQNAVQNNSKKTIEYNNYARMQELLCKDGDIWMWDPQDFEKGGVTVRTFATKEDADEYSRMKNEIRASHELEAIAFTVGTMDDYVQASADFNRMKKEREVKDFAAHIDQKIACQEHEIKALEALKVVCGKFDGKVINKRFHEAVKDATGYYNHFSSYHFELHCYGTRFEGKEPTIYISADWSHGYNSFTGQKKEMKDTDWQWYTNDRLEAQKAIAIIDTAINQRNGKISELKATKGKYSEYLKKARKAEELLKELNGYDFEIRTYAKENHLSRYVDASYIWAR